jgi:tetrahydromethanopterin S-methyltransferase subunit E
MLGVIIVLFGLIFGLQALPAAWKAGLSDAFATGNITGVIVIAGLILLAIDVALLLTAIARFRRDRLILD